jgi:hypothetical protein
MADRKISDLTALTAPASGDYLPIVDISESAAASKNKRITIEELMRGAPDGTAAAPSIAFESDPNTGIYSPGADQLAISTNAVERVEFGTSEVVFNDGGANYDFRIEGDTNANLLFVDASTDRVGLGTSSPQYQLDVNTSARILGGGTAGVDDRLFISSLGNGGVGRGAAIVFAPGGLSSSVTAARIIGYQLAAAVSANDAALAAQVADSSGTLQTRLYINNTGSVGIGTTSPGSALEINAAAATSPFIAKINTAEAARIDSSGRLLVGTSSASTLNATVQIVASQALSLHHGVNATTASVLTLSKSRNTTYNSYTIVQSGDLLGQIAFRGDDGTDYLTSAAIIQAEVDGTPGANDMPGRLVFSVTADGSASPTEALRISSNRAITVSDGGNVVLGTTTGTKIGTATTQKLGFYNKTPVVQPTAVADATDAASAITQLNALLARMRDLGLIAT